MRKYFEDNQLDRYLQYKETRNPYAPKPTSVPIVSKKRTRKVRIRDYF